MNRGSQVRLQERPLSGQHTREVLAGCLGLSDAEIDRLAAAGVLT